MEPLATARRRLGTVDGVATVMTMGASGVMGCRSFGCGDGGSSRPVRRSYDLRLRLMLVLESARFIAV